MESNAQIQSASKKRPRHVMPADFMGSFSDKQSFYTYMKEQL
jgi:hypothetical protein